MLELTSREKEYKTMNLLTLENAKTVKGQKKGFLTGILYLKPYNSGGYKNVCPSATAGCVSACLNTAGRGRFDKIQNGRQRKTTMYFTERELFLFHLRKDINAVIRKAQRQNLIPCIRLNGTSDLAGLARLMAKEFPNVQFYDYTKLPNPQKRLLPNYHLTFSKAENNWADCLVALENGVNVSVVFDKIPQKQYKGYRVINGDETDLRFLDNRYKKTKKGIIVALKAKGQAKKDDSGFVVRTIKGGKVNV